MHLNERNHIRIILLDQSDGGPRIDWLVSTVRTCGGDGGGEGAPSGRGAVGSLAVVGVGGGEGLPAQVGERRERGGAALCKSTWNRTRSL